MNEEIFDWDTRGIPRPEITKIRTSCGRSHLESPEVTTGGASYQGEKLHVQLVRVYFGITNTHPAAPPPPATWAPSPHHLSGHMGDHDCLLSPTAEKVVGPVVMRPYTNELVWLVFPWLWRLSSYETRWRYCMIETAVIRYITITGLLLYVIKDSVNSIWLVLVVIQFNRQSLCKSV